MQAAGIGTWDLNLQTQEVRWSDNLQRMFGIVPGSFDGQLDTVMTMIHPEDLPRVQTRIRQAVEEDADYNIEFRFLKPDGTIRWALGMGRVFCDADGQPVELAGIDMDITERKQAEATLLQYTARLEFVLETNQLGTWEVNLQAQPYVASPRSLRHDQIYGYDSLLPDWNYDTFLSHIHPEDRQQVETTFQQALRTHTPWNIECRIYRVDGACRWVWISGSIDFDETEQPQKLIGIIADITPRKATEAALRQSEDRLRLALESEQAAREVAEHANRIKDEFLAILSHELRSPLNPILGWAKLLQVKQMSAEVTTRALETIERNARLQAQLIDDLLDIARILRGKLKLEVAAVDPIFVIEAAIETVQSAADAKAISIQTDLQQVGQVHGDAGRLQQVVWNILTNAVKFTPEGGQVHVQLSQVDRWAQIQVADTGIGIPPEFLPHIFESFRQEDTSVTRQYGGLGLGLAIVRYLVEAHGGTITADSPGAEQGATFTIKLPLFSASPALISPNPGIPTEVNLTGMRVLVVDDSPDALELLTISLEEYGAEVRAFDRAADVLDNLAIFRPDVLICDIGMPDMDGYTLIKHIRSLPSDQGQVPAIALTAYVRDEERQKALSQGFQSHVAKPFDPHHLAITVAELYRAKYS
jgi:hypothetical protein